MIFSVSFLVFFSAFLSFLLTKMASRPRRSCTVAQPKPVLSEIQEKLYDSTEEEVRQTALSVSRFFKMDIDAIAEFWFSDLFSKLQHAKQDDATDAAFCQSVADISGYNLKNYNHRLVLRWVLESQGLKHDKSVEFLHSLPLNLVRSLGLQRVTNAQGTVFYRIQTGELTYYD